MKNAILEIVNTELLNIDDKLEVESNSVIDKKFDRKNEEVNSVSSRSSNKKPCIIYYNDKYRASDRLKSSNSSFKKDCIYGGESDHKIVA